MFAPTDDAFTALTEALDVTVDELLAYPLLPAVLQYHVVGAEASRLICRMAKRLRPYSEKT